MEIGCWRFGEDEFEEENGLIWIWIWELFGNERSLDVWIVKIKKEGVYGSCITREKIK